MAKWAGEEHICIVTGRPGADLHHIYTRKARPDLVEKLWNKLPLSHHLHVEAHSQGMKRMAEQHKAIERWLVLWGWEFDGRRWWHPEAVLGGH